MSNGFKFWGPERRAALDKAREERRFKVVKIPAKYMLEIMAGKIQLATELPVYHEQNGATYRFETDDFLVRVVSPDFEPVPEANEAPWLEVEWKEVA